MWHLLYIYCRYSETDSKLYVTFFLMTPLVIVLDPELVKVKTCSAHAICLKSALFLLCAQWMLNYMCCFVPKTHTFNTHTLSMSISPGYTYNRRSSCKSKTINPRLRLKWSNICLVRGKDITIIVVHMLQERTYHQQFNFELLLCHFYFSLILLVKLTRVKIMRGNKAKFLYRCIWGAYSGW